MRIAQHLNREGVRWFIAWVAAFMYLLSLALPVVVPFKPDFNQMTLTGLDSLIFGLGLLIDLDLTNIHKCSIALAWFTNPAIWVAILAVIRGAWRVSFTSSCLAILFAVPVPFQLNPQDLLYPGYWTWLASGLFLYVISAWVVGSMKHIRDHESTIEKNTSYPLGPFRDSR